MRRSSLLKGGRLIDPAAGLDGAFDLLVRDGQIADVDAAGRLPVLDDGETIDCAGLWIMPGLIDPHVHLRDPGFPVKETIATGLRAAAAGGFATVAAMANTSPVNDAPEIARYMLERAREARGARLIPVSAVTIGLRGRELVDFAAMAAAGARLFSDDGIPIDDQAVLSQALDAARGCGLAISLHEEDRDLTADGAMNAGETSKRLGVKGIPVGAETARVRRDLALAIGSEAPVHVAHVSAAESIELIQAARKNGAIVTCEVTPHHFTLDDGAVLEWGPDARMAPPLRGRADVDAIVAAMAGGAIDMIATDHAPHDPASKLKERLGGLFGRGRAPRLSTEDALELARAANGIVGLETAVGLTMALVHRGIIAPSRMAEMMSTNPARLLRLDDAGTLTMGARADITLIDPEREWTVEPARFESKSRNTPFAGMKLRGRAVMTMVAGEIIYDRRGGEDR
ncbi:MAG TPA: dihydroorotase [Candidatus Binataceae bacterium]|nr:dihydroorotase [Candidatus Binataceae bacterium]